MSKFQLHSKLRLWTLATAQSGNKLPQSKDHCNQRMTHFIFRPLPLSGGVHEGTLSPKTTGKGCVAGVSCRESAGHMLAN
jgi:hypothetical protein